MTKKKNAINRNSLYYIDIAHYKYLTYIAISKINLLKMHQRMLVIAQCLKRLNDAFSREIQTVALLPIDTRNI